ncbi:MAG: TylF/MycF/NovP-related O-methyltransferase [Flavobacteriales bacterium]
MHGPSSSYIHLLKRTLCGFRTQPFDEYHRMDRYSVGWKATPLKWLDILLNKLGYRIVKRVRVNPEKRFKGHDIPSDAYTMIGMNRLNHLEQCVSDVLNSGIPGDLVETGSWRGGATMLMKAMLIERKITNRTVWVADSFRGLPPPDEKKYPADRNMDLHKRQILSANLSEVKQAFIDFDLLDERVQFLEGWFKDTLPVAPIEKIALLRLDGDMYESTLDALTHLYPKLSSGGIVIVDDYGSFQACKSAVDDYRNAHQIREDIVDLDGETIHWIKL